ncbi:MAG: hypothetical protein ACK4S4_08060 [Pyrinomonadaceae bacterium]
MNIPYVAENDRLDRSSVGKELAALNIGEAAKHEAFSAIYNKRPRGVNFASLVEAALLERALYRLGVPFRSTIESEYKYELLP